MISPHSLNILLHVGAGMIAMTIGLGMLTTAKGTQLHRTTGRFFVGFTLAVCATAAVGNIVFRFMPLFAVLTVLVLYQLLSGWRVIYTKASGPNYIDAALCAVAAVVAVGLVPLMLGNAGRESAPVVVYATLATLFALIVYDALRWVFPRCWHAKLWQYEHIYKLISSLFAMMSAAAGNLFPQGQPWSQLLPSAAGLACIAWFFWVESRRRVHTAVDSGTRSLSKAGL